VAQANKRQANIVPPKPRHNIERLKSCWQLRLPKCRHLQFDCHIIWTIAMAILLPMAIPHWGEVQAVPASDRSLPTSGPVSLPGKKVLFISYEYSNISITQVYRNFAYAARLIGWSVDMANGQGDQARIGRLIMSAIRNRQDGIVLGSIQFSPAIAPALKAARLARIKVVGWHAAATPGPSPFIFTNVATRSEEVARLAADFVIHDSQGRAGVVLFNDSRFDVANEKIRQMQLELAHCIGCRVLKVVDIPISLAAERVPDYVIRLNSLYGKRWTYALAINDAYFDAIGSSLHRVGRGDLRAISAGDGSERALGRIRLGFSQQIATISDPLGLQGWQLVDELNRAFSGQSPSGFQSTPLLLTRERLKRLGPSEIDAEMPYQPAYLAIWKPNRR